MAEQFEYLVCQAQAGRVTFVNGDWQGTAPLEDTPEDEALESCPWLWDYLNTAGHAGWLLVSTGALRTDPSEPERTVQVLYLQRIKR